jgi:dihydroflavonol-4-reductase
MAVTLVTGATGFIGSHLVEALLARGDEVRCLVLPKAGLGWLPKDKVRIFPIAAAAPERFADALQGVDLVFHLAGATKARNQREYHKTNVTITRQLLEAVQRYAPAVQRVVMISSQAAVGPARPGQIADETTACHPVTYYGQSKLAAEEAVKHYPAVPCVILRPVTVYGPRDHDVLVLLKAINRHFAPVIGSLDRSLTFVYVEDLVQAMLRVAAAPKAVGQTYFVTDGNVYTWRATKDLIEKVLQQKAVSIVVPRPLVWVAAAASEIWSRIAGVPTIFNLNKVKEIVAQNWACSGEKLMRDTGYRPSVQLEDGLHRTAAWARANGWL